MDRTDCVIYSCIQICKCANFFSFIFSELYEATLKRVGQNCQCVHYCIWYICSELMTCCRLLLTGNA